MSLVTLTEMGPAKDSGNSRGIFDCDLHGIVGIRLIDASEAEVAIVTRQIGPIQKALSRDPDITIRFVDQLPASSRLRYLGVDDAAFSDDAFLVLRSKHKSRARVQIPFEAIGQRCEIVCERGLQAVPLLIPIINLTALSKGAMPLHASAFSYKSIGALATGWAKGGKTETLLAFMARGADYVGDEWVYLSPDGQSMFGIPEPIRVWDWHLQDLPEYRSLIPLSDRTRLRGLSLLVNSLERVMSNGIGYSSSPTKLVVRIIPLLKNQMYVHLPPKKVFGADSSPMAGKPELIFFVASHESPKITVEATDPEKIAERMVFSLEEERLDFLSAYLKFRFAFPEKVNRFIEELEGLQRETLKRVLKDKRAYTVHHPYPVHIPSLFEALSPYFR